MSKFGLAVSLLMIAGNLGLTSGFGFNLGKLVSNTFSLDQNLPLQASRLNSVKTHIPFDYYQLPFC